MQLTYDDIIKELCESNHYINYDINYKYINNCLEILNQKLLLNYIYNLIKVFDNDIKFKRYLYDIVLQKSLKLEFVKNNNPLFSLNIEIDKLSIIFKIFKMKESIIADHYEYKAEYIDSTVVLNIYNPNFETEFKNILGSIEQISSYLLNFEYAKVICKN